MLGSINAASKRPMLDQCCRDIDENCANMLMLSQRLPHSVHYILSAIYWTAKKYDIFQFGKRKKKEENNININLKTNEKVKFIFMKDCQFFRSKGINCF